DRGPPLPSVAHALDDQATGFGVQLHFVAEFCLLEQRLGNPDAARVANSHDACLGCHGDYIVITVRRYPQAAARYVRKMFNWHRPAAAASFALNEISRRKLQNVPVDSPAARERTAPRRIARRDISTDVIATRAYRSPPANSTAPTSTRFSRDTASSRPAFA